MVTREVIQRVFHLAAKETSGKTSTFTGFTLDIDDKQYLCTARHCVVTDPYESDCETLLHPDHLYINNNKRWEILDVQLVGFGTESADICIFALKQELSPRMNTLPASPDGIVYSQDVYFLGYPLGLNFDVKKKENNNYPLPFVKKATVSAFSSTKKTPRLVCLDGIANRGFSGGPVVFKKGNENSFSVASIIAGYELEPESTEEFKLNSGITYSHCISHALDAIKNNPIGMPITPIK